MTTSIVDDALNYEKIIHTYGTYQLSKVVQQAGLQTMTVGAAGGVESVFEIPAKVFNLSKSFLSFTIGPDTAAGANNYNWANIDGFSAIRQVQLYTRGGLYLCDINDFDRYTNMTLRRNVLCDDMFGWDNPSPSALIAATSGNLEGLAVNANGVAVGQVRPDNSALISPYKEPLYVLNAGVNTLTPSFNVLLNLSSVKNSILSENKDLWFGGEILYLRVVWNTPSKVFFTGVANQYNPSAGAIAYAGGAVIQNLLFYLAIEVDFTIENMIKSKASTAEGLQVLLPVIYYCKLNLGSTNQNVTTRYNRSNGIKLKKIYWTTYNNQETSNTAYDHSNLAGAKVSQFYTMVNNIRTSQYDYVTANNDDWKAKRNLTRYACLFTSNEYYYNWVWEENFTDNNPLLQKVLELHNNMIEGLDLTDEIKFDIYATTANANFNHYIYAITEKMLTVSPSSITLM